MFRRALPLLAALVAVLPAAACDEPCVPVPCAALTLTDPSVDWRIDAFHVRICLGAACEEADVPLDAALATPFPDLGGSVTMKSGAMDGISAFAAELGEGDAGTVVHTGDTVHVVVTEPRTGVTICDMSATVPEATPELRRCGTCATRAVSF